MVDDRIEVINPKGELVTLPNEPEIIKQALESGYQKREDFAGPLALPNVPDYTIPDAPDRFKVINPKGEVVSLPRTKEVIDQIQEPDSGYELYNKEKDDRKKAAQEQLKLTPDTSSLKDSLKGVPSVIETIPPPPRTKEIQNQLNDAVMIDPNAPAVATQKGIRMVNKETGDEEIVPMLEVVNKLGDYRFKDKNFEKVFDTRTEQLKNRPNIIAGAEAGGKQIDDLFGNPITNSFLNLGNNFDVANALAFDMVKQEHPNYVAAANAVPALLASELLGPLAGTLGKSTTAALGGGKIARALGVVAEQAVSTAPFTIPDIVENRPTDAAADLGVGILTHGLFHGLGAAAEGVGNLARRAVTPAESTTESITKNLINEVDHLAPTQKIAALQEYTSLKPFDEIVPKLDSVPGSNLAQDLVNIPKTTPKAIEASEQITKALKRVTEEDGSISLQGLVKIIKNNSNAIADEIPGAMEFRKEFNTMAQKEFFNLGNQAVESSLSPKIAVQWEMATKIHNAATTLVDVAVKDPSILRKGGMDLLKDFAQNIAQGIKNKVGAAPGAIAGGMVGGLPGAVAGGAASDLVLKAGWKTISPGIKGFIENSALVGSLKKLASHAQIASLVAIDALKAGDGKIARIPAFLKSMSDPASRAAVAYTDGSHHDIVKTILGDKATGLSRVQQFNKLSEHLSTLVGSPGMLQAQAQALSAPFAEAHPQLAAQLAQDHMNRIQYLHDIMPKSNQAPKPFQKNEKFVPTKDDLDQFNQQMQIANNPYALLDHLKDGTLTVKQVATASALNPIILNKIRDAIQTEAHSGKINLPYKQRLQASLLMGQPMEASLNHVGQLQSVYNNQSQPQPQQAPEKKTRKSKSGNSHQLNLNSLPSAFTPSQRVQK